MFPNGGKLICNACGKSASLNVDDEKEYKIVKTIPHSDKDLSPAIIGSEFAGEKISADDRKAYDEFFGTND